jgi:formate dehydrogenase subunit beta
MSDYWKIETKGDPLGAVQHFMQAVWEQAHLDRLLTSDNGSPGAHLIDDPLALGQVNPFRPLMRENLARHVPGALNHHPEEKVGVLLRPCEMRALVEMHKRDPIARERLVSVCFDCLGTYPQDEYEWRAARIESQERLSSEPLRFARQGGILAYRYRAACQTCASPGSESADLNIHVLGLPVREQILVHTGNHGSASVVDLADLTNGPAEEELVAQHTHILARQAEIHHQTMERVMKTLGDLLPRDSEQLVRQFESCGDCQRCMAACPICTAEFPRRGPEGRYPIQAIQRWLISCAGCGMCEQVCTSNLPLGVIFGTIRERLKAEYEYMPGGDWAEQLPL